MGAPLSFSTSSRSLKADNGSGNGIICSSYKDVHMVNFSYTIDTASSDESFVRSAIGELETFSLDWLAANLLPCNGVRNLADAFISLEETSDEELEDKVQRDRQLRPDMSRELGIVGLKTWPDDILSSSSECRDYILCIIHISVFTSFRRRTDIGYHILNIFYLN